MYPLDLLLYPYEILRVKKTNIFVLLKLILTLWISLKWPQGPGKIPGVSRSHFENVDINYCSVLIYFLEQSNIDIYMNKVMFQF